MAHLGLCWPILTPSWACSDGLAGLSWGHWALLWAKFGVWRVAFGGRSGKNGDVVENQKNMEKHGKTQEIWPNIGPFCAAGVQDLGLCSGWGPMGLSKV